MIYYFLEWIFNVSNFCYIFSELKLHVYTIFFSSFQIALYCYIKYQTSPCKFFFHIQFWKYYERLLKLLPHWYLKQLPGLLHTAHQKNLQHDILTKYSDVPQRSSWISVIPLKNGLFLRIGKYFFKISPPVGNQTYKLYLAYYNSDRNKS